MHEKILLVSSNDTTTTKEMKTDMSNNLKTRYTTMLNELLVKCSYLYPQFCCAYLYNKDEAMFDINLLTTRLSNELYSRSVELSYLANYTF